MPTEAEQLKKTLTLAALAICAAGVMILAIQYAQHRTFWKEIDEYRTESRYADFLEWLREHPENP